MSIINTGNKLLRQASEAIEAKLTPENRGNYDKIVVAGMQAAIAKGLNGMMAGIVKYKDPIQACALGAVNLVLLLRGHAVGHMPEQAMVPASYTLMLQALSFCEEAKIVKIGVPELDRATRLWTNTIFSRMRISPANLSQMATMANGIMNDPGKMQMIHLHTGYARDPRAPQPMEEMAPVAAPMNRRARRAAARAGRQ